MDKNRRFSILPFPQFFDGNTLALNLVVLPRNQNPLKPAIEQHATIPDAPAFADAGFAFEARIVSGLSSFPHSLAATSSQPLVITPPTQARELFQALGKNFSITNLTQTNENLDNNQIVVSATIAVVERPAICLVVRLLMMDI